MKKIYYFIIAVNFLITSLGFAQEPPQLKRLSDHVHAYIDIKHASASENSYGANCGVVIGEDAAMVIDTLISAKKAQELIVQIRSITDRPIRYVVNTHYHLDHSWGNSAFEKLGATIIAHKNMPLTKEQISESIAHPEEFGLTADDLAGTQAVLPDIRFDDSLDIDLGGVTVTLRFWGAAHTR